MNNPWTSHGQSTMNKPWTVCKQTMKSMNEPWTRHGQSINKPWTVPEQSLNKPWKAMDNPWPSRGQSMKKPWTVQPCNELSWPPPWASRLYMRCMAINRWRPKWNQQSRLFFHGRVPHNDVCSKLSCGFRKDGLWPFSDKDFFFFFYLF